MFNWLDQRNDMMDLDAISARIFHERGCQEVLENVKISTFFVAYINVKNKLYLLFPLKQLKD